MSRDGDPGSMLVLMWGLAGVGGRHCQYYVAIFEGTFFGQDVFMRSRQPVGPIRYIGSYGWAGRPVGGIQAILPLKDLAQ